MVGHQTICRKLACAFIFPLGEVVRIVVVVIVANKDRHTVMATMDHMMWAIGNCTSTYARHENDVAQYILISNKQICPIAPVLP